MAGEITYRTLKGTPENLTSLITYKEEDIPLLQRVELDTVFNANKHRLDTFFYSLDGRFLNGITDSKSYSVLKGGSKDAESIEDITLNPTKDVIDAGYRNGDVNVLYNFINNLFSEKNTQPKFYIESISSDRTEIRVQSNEITDRNIVRFVDSIKSRLNDSSYFEDFRLNFGRNLLLIGVNLDRRTLRGNQAVVIKLYEPLPLGIEVKDTFTIEELVGDSVLYQVVTDIEQLGDGTTGLEFLAGPNFNIELVEENNNPTGYLNFSELFSYPVTNSYYEVYSLFNEKGSQISINHTDYNDFIQFSSAEERLRNFYYKASLLESYRNQIDARNTYTGSLDLNIEGIINNFDHYDRYLYYESSSYSWPKTNTARPYALFSTGSTEVQSWYTAQLISASNFDAGNQDRLINAIPSFIREDSSNTPYLLFVDMIGQHFDNIWIYSKAVTDKYDADNRLDFGISKDLVRDAVENFGIKLYNNNEALENLFAAFTGEAYDTGSETTVNSLIVAVEGSGSLSGSVGNEHLQPMPKASYQKEVYKRIYHNIPLLLKSKGTERGLRALINCLGIPSEVLPIKVFGGVDKDATPFYGASTELTSSLDKIRIINTDSVTEGSTLSNFTSVVNYGKDYSKDLHSIDVSLSPTDSLNEYIKAHPSMSSFNIDDYIGDPRTAYSSSYTDLNKLGETVFTSGSSFVNPVDAFEFVRFIKFFDNSLFRIIKDFIPSRSNVTTGISIKPHILNRSKIKQPEVKWSNQSSPAFFTHTETDLDFTGSYYSTNFSIDGEIDTAFITGSTGLGLIDSASYSYTETYANPSGGYQTLTKNYHDQSAYTGELSGSIIQASNGDLTAGNTFRKLEPEQFSFKYIPRNDFSTPQGALDQFTKTVSLNNIEESTSESPSQAGEGSDPLELSIPAYNSVHGYNKVQFNLDGGPIDGTPATDSGSILWDTDEELDTNDSVLINFTVDFNDISSFVDDDGTLTEVTLAIYSGSSTGTSVPVSTQTVTRTSLSSQREFVTLSYTNTGSLLTGDPQKWYWKASYESNYNTENILSNVNDVEISLKPILTYYDTDAITLYLSETIENDFTSSKAEAMIVPFNSPTNGYVKPYIEQANEVVFQYSAFETTDNYNNTVITSSVEGGSYRASISLTDDDINLTHITSAPYSASFTQALPALTDGDTLKFNFTVDFDSYWSTYLNTYNFANTPFVTASIRNKDTGVVTGSLSFQIQQGQYPNEYKRTLSYLNDTGGNLQDLEFYYQVNIPSSFGAGNPKVNLKNISITYNTPNTVFLNTGIKSFKNVGFNLGFLQFTSPIEVSSGSLDYFTITNDYFNVGFLPGESELFKFNDYASISNNVDSIRRSTTRLLVDEKTYTPTQGSYRGFFLPGNYAILSSSIANGVEGLDERFFAEVQDSNYYATGWRNGRYDGTETTNRRRGARVLGLEPSVNFDSFTGYRFLDTATTASIRDLVASVGDAAGEDRQDSTIYYNKYESKLLGDVLTEFESVGGNAAGSATLNSSTVNSFGVTVSGLSQGLYNWSGSIGEYIDGGKVQIDFNVTYDFWTDDEISGSLAPVSPGTRTPSEFTISLIDLDDGGTTLDTINTLFSDGVFVGKPNGYDDVYNYTFTLQSDVISKNVAIKFVDNNLYEESAGTTGVTFDFNSIKKSNFIPVNNPTSGIVAQTPEIKTFFYEEVTPTPSSPNGFQTTTNSKIYRLDTDEILTTNDLGIVTNIE